MAAPRSLSSVTFGLLVTAGMAVATECSVNEGTAVELLRSAVASFTSSPSISDEDERNARQLHQQLETVLNRKTDSTAAAVGSGATGRLFDKAWLERVSRFYSADTGTELIAPLLYTLIRSTRPRTVVEFGCGYTTLFLAQALTDAADEARTELSPERQSDPSSWLLRTSERGKKLMGEWERSGAFFGEGKLQRRAHAEYRPKLHCVDMFSTEAGQKGYFTSADAFREAAVELGVSSVLTVHQSEWMEWTKALTAAFPPIDFLWWDGFRPPQFSRVWKRVNPNGGLCVLHSTLGNSRNFAWLQALKLKHLSKSYADFEVLSLLEGHKWAQNSCTMLRKTSAYEAEEVVARPHP